jgi:hypothetical protein
MMDFVTIMSWEPGLTREQRDEALMRRAEWKYPEGMEVIAEYWLAAENAAVVVISRAESFDPFMEIELTWSDKFHIDSHPAVSAEEGLRVGPAAMARRDA